MAITFGTQTNGNETSATPTITLPSRSAGDSVLLFVSRNNDSSSWAGDADASVSEITSAATGRLVCLLVTPDDTETASFVLTTSGLSINGWMCVAVSGLDESALEGTNGYVGSNTSSAIPMYAHDLNYTLDGTEVILAVGGTNSTAIWTTSGSTLYNTTSGNATLMVEQITPTEGETHITPADLDRGNDTVARGESAATVVLTSGVTNFLLTGGFEYDSNADGLAEDWTEEHTTATAATNSLSTDGDVNGTYSQRMQYTGEGGNDGTQKVEFYQFLDDEFVAGEACTFKIYLSGSLSGGSVTLAVEAHNQSTGYIAEESTTIAAGAVDATPTQYTVPYASLPANTDRVVFAVLANELTSSAAVDLYFDKAELVAGAEGGGTSGGLLLRNVG